MKKVVQFIFHHVFIFLFFCLSLTIISFLPSKVFATKNNFKDHDFKNNQSAYPRFTTINLSDQLFSNLKITSSLKLPKGRESEFAENDIVLYNPDGGMNCGSSSSGTYTGSLSISGSTYFEKAWSGFRSAGFTKEQTAGILANLKEEADAGPTQHEGEYYPSAWKGQSHSSAEHVDGHFDLSKNEKIAYGVGMIQFSFGWRTHFIKFLESNATDVLELFNQPEKYSTAKISEYPSEDLYNKAVAIQIDYMLNESYSNPEKYHYFVEAREKQSMNEMAAFWASAVEQCGNCGPGGSQYSKRVQNAEEMYKQYSHESFMTSGSSSSNYTSGSSSSSSSSSTEEEFETEEENGSGTEQNGTDQNQTNNQTNQNNPDNNQNNSQNNQQNNTSSSLDKDSSLKDKSISSFLDKAILASEQTPAGATLLPKHNIITFYSADASENGGAKNAGKNASSTYNNGLLADGQAAMMMGNADPDLKLGDVIYIETTDDQTQEGAFVNRKYYIITDLGAHDFKNGKKTIDIFHDVKNPSDNNKAPFGQSSSAKVYKVASNVSWDDYLKKYYQKTESPTVDNSGKSVVNVKWKDGWIVDGFEGFHREDAIDYPQKHGFVWQDSSHLGDYITTMKNGSVGPNKILLHSTEGVHSDEKTALDQYGKEYFFPAHFMVDMKHHWVYQAFPITKPADGIRAHDNSAGVQIEVVGSCNPETELKEWYLYDENNFKEDDWMYLAKLIFAISQETKIPLTTNVDWKSEPSKRITEDEFVKYEGVLGHMHAPHNDHYDPRNMWEKLSKLFDKLQGGSDNGCGSLWDGNVPIYSQCDPKWKDLPYGGSGTICNSGCGPSSFAMLATMLVGRTITPDETTKIAGDAGMHIAGSGSSWKITKVLGDHYGLEVEDLNNYSKSQQADLVSQKLQSGWMIHISGKGGDPFSSGGHFIGIRGITADGKWLLVDSAGSRGERNMQKAWDPSEVLAYSHNIQAVRKK